MSLQVGIEPVSLGEFSQRGPPSTPAWVPPGYRWVPATVFPDTSQGAARSGRRWPIVLAPAATRSDPSVRRPRLVSLGSGRHGLLWRKCSKFGGASPKPCPSEPVPLARHSWHSSIQPAHCTPAATRWQCWHQLGSGGAEASSWLLQDALRGLGCCPCPLCAQSGCTKGVCAGWAASGHLCPHVWALCAGGNASMDRDQGVLACLCVGVFIHASLCL